MSTRLIARMMLAACGTVLLLLTRPIAAAVPVPTITGPITTGITGKPDVLSFSFDATHFGYVEEEFFLAGTASSFTSASALGSDGLWTATPADTAAYQTRIVVRRPADAAQFNGTVVVEWLNVSGGLDAAPDWTYLHTFLLREGFAWVGVSAQKVGIDGGGGGIPGLNLSLKAVDPTRYGVLVHPGDSFSYDMFSQVAAALRTPGAVAPLGGLTPERVIAVGESQSAFRMVTYVNAIHSLAHVYDGFLIHSRGGGSAALSQSPQASVGTPTPAFIRTDIDVPVLTFETETDLILLGFFPTRQRDTRRIRTWEVAGTAHADTYQLGVGATDLGPAAADTTYLPPTTSVFGIITCAKPINAAPQQYVLIAAMRQLDRWVQHGPRARRAKRLRIVAGSPPTIVLDVHGNARGGVRTPQLDVPIATYSGLGQSGGSFCGLFGTTALFDATTLAGLYPTHDAYVAAVRKRTRAAVRAGFVLQLDGDAIVASAAASNIGN